MLDGVLSPAPPKLKLGAWPGRSLGSGGVNLTSSISRSEQEGTDGTLEVVLAKQKAQSSWWLMELHHVLLGHPSASA